MSNCPTCGIPYEIHRDEPRHTDCAYDVVTSIRYYGHTVILRPPETHSLAEPHPDDVARYYREGFEKRFLDALGIEPGQTLIDSKGSPTKLPHSYVGSLGGRCGICGDTEDSPRHTSENDE